jgi:DNA-binding transcriptional ArsR family regulator
MSDENTALIACYRLEALGNMTRLAIFRLLVRAGDGGLAVGDIQRRLAVPASTLSHHLQRLTHVGLMSQERRGRVLVCRADFAAMDGVVAYLTEECCSDAGGRQPQAGQAKAKAARSSRAGGGRKPARTARPKRSDSASPPRAAAARA